MEKPNYMWSMLTMKCPRCRRGHMFKDSNPWRLRHTMKMPEKCPECGQPFELEVGFWYGTGYVSYALSLVLSAVTFVAWCVLVGISTHDYRFFLWMGLNAVFLVVMQPWLMRLSRVIYLYFFVRYDEDYRHSKPKQFDYESESYYRNNEGKV